MNETESDIEEEKEAGKYVHKPVFHFVLLVSIHAVGCRILNLYNIVHKSGEYPGKFLSLSL